MRKILNLGYNLDKSGMKIQLLPHLTQLHNLVSLWTQVADTSTSLVWCQDEFEHESSQDITQEWSSIINPTMLIERPRNEHWAQSTSWIHASTSQCTSHSIGTKS